MTTPSSVSVKGWRLSMSVVGPIMTLLIIFFCLSFGVIDSSILFRQCLWLSMFSCDVFTEALFLDLNLCISNGTVSTKIYDKRDNFDFDIVNFPFLDGDVPGVPHMVYINLLDSPELLQILMTLTTVIKPLLPNFLGRAIVILNCVRRFRYFIADTVPW